jgi:hypothetical protein
MDGEVYVDADSEGQAELEAEKAMERGSGEIDWLEPGTRFSK